jgi:putative ATP-dependent endonuclease of OLD family
LDRSDYQFLRRFLDATKANLFFAKGVAIVEGDAENILLPVIAELLKQPFSKHGVSVVNVGSRGLFRYVRIFQRKGGPDMPIRVACLADRDVPPDAATYVPKRTNRAGKELPTFDSDFKASDVAQIEADLKANDGGSVQSFVSPAWTLEHDLALYGLAEDVHVAIQLARKARRKPRGLTSDDFDKTEVKAREKYKAWVNSGLTREEIAANVYEDLFRGRASKAEAAQFLAEVLHRRAPKPKVLRKMLPKYLTEAIDYLTGFGAPGDAADASPD